MSTRVWDLRPDLYHGFSGFLKSDLGGSEENSEVADVCAGWAGDDEVVELFEERVRVAASEVLFGVEVQVLSSLDRCFVGDGAGGGTVAVDAVSAGAQDDGVGCLIVKTESAAQRGFEVSAAVTVSTHRAGELAARDRTGRTCEKEIATFLDWLLVYVGQHVT